MSDSVRPHRWQPTRLLCPWDSPGKNTGVGCHFLLQCIKVKVKSLSRVQLLATPWTAAYQAPLSMGFSRQEYWSGVPLPSLSQRTNNVYFLQHLLADILLRIRASLFHIFSFTMDSWILFIIQCIIIHCFSSS